MAIDGVIPQRQANATTAAAATRNLANVREKMVEQLGAKIGEQQAAAIERGEYSTSMQLWADHEPGVSQEQRVEVFMSVLTELRDTLQGPEYNLGAQISWPRNGCGGSLGCDLKLDWSTNPARSSGAIPPYEYSEISL